MKICFVALNVYPFFFSEAPVGSIGGAELQQMMIGEALCAKGIDVSLVSHDVGQSDLLVKDGLKFIKAFAPDAGLTGVRFFYPRLTELWNALKKADADVYYVRCAGFLPGLLAIFCRLYGRKFVFASASDTDLIPGKEMVRLMRDRWLFRKGLNWASAVLVQSEYQQELLLKNYGLKGVVIRNFYKAPYRTADKPVRDIILWVATIKSIKRPMFYVNLAERFPNERFVMIGGPDGADPNLFESVRERCAGITNLDFLGFCPIDVTETYFNRCKIFVNTSEYEGFPNTFLQSWSRGIPVLSSVDPDGVISKYNLGYKFISMGDMVQGLASLLSSHDDHNDTIERYFKENHADGVIAKYCTLLNELVD